MSKVPPHEVESGALEDSHSFGGSLHGTLVSRRSKATLRGVDNLAKSLRDYHARDSVKSAAGLPDLRRLAKWDSLAAGAHQADVQRARCNGSFHHFRYFVVFMAGLAMALMLMMRNGITISLLKMVNQTHLYLEEHPDRTVDDFLAEGYSLGGEFIWNNEIVSIILSWYMIAYTLPQIPGTQLALKIGGHKSIAIAVFVCAVSLILTPAAAHLGWQFVVATRLLNGLGASSLIAVTLNTIETWMREDEVSLGLAITQGVSSLMMMLSPLFMGYLTKIHWVYSFYVPAAASFIFCLVWYVSVSNRPEGSRLISERELRHILAGGYAAPKLEQARKANSCDAAKGPELSERQPEAGAGAGCAGQALEGQCAPELEDEDAPKSWMIIFKVNSFYAYLVTWTIYCCANHGYMYILPTYLRQFLKVGVADNGFYGFVICAGCIAPVIWPHLLHKLLLRSNFSPTSSRAVMQTICCLGSAATWIYVGVYHDNQILALFLNRCFIGANDMVIPGSLMANYGRAGLTSVAFSVMNSISDILIVPTSTSIGWALDYMGQSRECWSWIFVTLGLTQVFAWIIFIVFVHSNPIRFNELTKNSSKGDIERQARLEEVPKIKAAA